MRVHIAALFTTLTALPLAAQDDSDLFTKLDANKDGFVTADEVPEANKALFDRLLRNADKNSDSKLSKEEFQAGLKPAEGPRPPLGGAERPGFPGTRPDPRELFNRMDANKDGKLTKDELAQRERLPENFALLDANSDGSISQDEFMEFGRRFGQRPPGAPNQNNQANQANPQVFEALFDRTDSNSDGKLTKDEVPEERQVMRSVLERAGGEISKDQFVRGMTAAMQAGGQPPRPDGAPQRRPDGAPGSPPPGGGLFAALDTDRDGQLSNAEIVGAGSALLKLDRNNDGKLTPDEVFAAGPGRPGERRPGDGRPGDRAGRGSPDPAPGDRRPGQRGPGSLEAFRDRLKQADTNNDGKLSKDEAPPFLKERFDRLDTNSDGFLDQEETRRLLDQRPRPNSDQPRRDGEDKK
jgi:Ca2+-binding EF-hand superfamily protein